MSETTKIPETMRLLAFRAKSGYTKEFFTTLTRKHRDADILKAGSYKSCTVGCLNKPIGNNGSDHAALARDMCVDEAIIHLADKVFERLPEEHRPDWHVRWVEAIPDGADTALFRPRFLGKLLRELLTLPDVSSNAKVASAINGSIAVRDNWLATGKPDKEAAAWMAALAARAADPDLPWERIADMMIEALQECAAPTTNKESE